jgi:hypothetical protein
MAIGTDQSLHLSFLAFSFLLAWVTAPILAHADNVTPLGPAPEAVSPAPHYVSQHRRGGVLFDLANLDGVDTVLVGISTVPDHTLLPLHEPTVAEMKTHPPDPIVTDVKEIFAKYPWISVKDSSSVPVQEWSKPNVVFLNFAVSARNDVTDGRPVKTGALALQLWKYESDGPHSAIPVIPATYPFIIPATEDAFNKTIADGVHFLISYLPSYFMCANKYGEPTAQCPDCSIEACKTERPFGDYGHPKCGVFVKGKLVPCWVE